MSSQEVPNAFPNRSQTVPVSDEWSGRTSEGRGRERERRGRRRKRAAAALGDGVFRCLFCFVLNNDGIRGPCIRTISN